ncbi:hypothetical protein JAAARDRAFT_47159 [Jaapia argillacea MUCL 33604]|uniref:Uncharacterized protein n=1 Tax=Jaapia argillacea MUCL 33604 TaxID=933084 RepID=A0A067PT19_9AGAM|nr:hypothetical protein JAAARDRAFT_47159 [Jaapia argillacea MUCL 33604]
MNEWMDNKTGTIGWGEEQLQKIRARLRKRPIKRKQRDGAEVENQYNTKSKIDSIEIRKEEEERYYQLDGPSSKGTMVIIITFTATPEATIVVYESFVRDAALCVSCSS